MDLAPADKKIYALRDSIAAVNSVPLIASSIMSKKIAAGANKIVIDVTYGSGAFMKNKLQAKRLAKAMKEIWKGKGKKICCVISKMEQPLGHAVGNTLELIEAVQALHGDMAEDLKEVVITMCVQMLKIAGKKGSDTQLKNEIWDVINSGKAFDKFVELAQRQGADVSYLYDLNKLEKAPIIIPVISDKEGWIKELNAEKVGKISIDLGAGRKQKEDEIDRRVGIILNKKIGDKVEKGDCLAYIHANNSNNIEEYVENLKSAYNIVNEVVSKEKIIDEIL
jgi:pyrimidine-nucleoside phosphorylase